MSELDRRTKLLELTLADKKKVIEKLKVQIVRLSNGRTTEQLGGVKKQKNQNPLGSSQDASIDKEFEADLDAFIGEKETKVKPKATFNAKKRKFNAVELNI